jgi:nucleotide-binding universal stress UspA family protein
VYEMSMFPAKVIWATDGSEDAARARLAAVELCQKTGSELHALHVGKPVYSMPATALGPFATDVGSGAYEEMETELEEEARGVLEEEVAKAEADGATIAQGHLRMGPAATEIVALAEELGAGLIVMGTRGLGAIERALLGSVSEAVVAHANCPVMVVRE